MYPISALFEMAVSEQAFWTRDTGQLWAPVGIAFAWQTSPDQFESPSQLSWCGASMLLMLRAAFEHPGAGGSDVGGLLLLAVLAF